jgi:hypothetical protein
MRNLKDDKLYHECMGITQSMPFCPNAFRVDMYRGCDFGCKYCFSEMSAFREQELSNWRIADFNVVKHTFETAFDTDKESQSVIIEMLRHKVPLHCGGMSDPFQAREWKYGLTRKLIELCNSYNYPIQFSTKTDHLPDSYYEILNPELHAFQISIMGWTDEYIKKFEANTPSAKSRLTFVEKLRKRGFWCGIRIQPIINMDECLLLMNEVGSVPSYYSLEHLHYVYNCNLPIQLALDNGMNGCDFNRKSHRMEVKTNVKKQNLQKLIGKANSYGVRVGVGDNELHYMSQSRCCCGLDTINDNFSNYLKYNLTYMSTGDCDIDELWYPKCNCRRHLNRGRMKELYCDKMVKDYIKAHPEYIGEQRKNSIESQLFGICQKKLF